MSARRALSILFMLATTVGVALPGDSLSVRDKGLINALAESTFKRYVALLDEIAGLEANDDESALLVHELIMSACGPGRDRMFLRPDVRIQDNVDPTNGPQTAGKDRPVEEYANDLLLYFQSRDPLRTAVEAKLLKMREPGVSEHTFTQVLYEMRFLGRHSQLTEPYVTHRRVLEFVAEPRAGGGWDVVIASDNFFDPSATFSEALLEQDLDSLARAGRKDIKQLTAAAAEYRSAFEQEQQREEQQRAERRLAFETAMAAARDQLTSGDFEGATNLLEQARSLDPLAVDPLVLLNETRRAMERKRLKDEADYASACEEGAALNGMRAYDRAKRSYERALVVKPGSTEVKALIDGLNAILLKKKDREKFHALGDQDKALAQVQAALKEPGRSGDVELLVLEARILIAKGLSGQAVPLLNTVLQREPRYLDALSLRASVLEKSNVPDQQQAAVADYYSLMLHDPWSPSYHHRLARLLCHTQGKCDEAMEVLEQAKTKAPNDAETHYQMGVLLAHRARHADALARFDGSLELDNACARCHLARGLSLLEMDRVADGEAAVVTAQRTGLSDNERTEMTLLAQQHLSKAKELQGLNAFAEADHHFLLACVLDPEQSENRLLKARNLMRFEQYSAAITDLDRYIEKAVTPFVGFLERGNCHLGAGNYDLALKDFETILSNNVESMRQPAMLGKARAFFAKGDPANAESLLKGVLKTEKRNGEVLAMMTKICLAAGRYEEAKGYGEQAVDADKMSGPYVYDLGLAYQAMLNDNAAVRCFEKSITLGYDRADAKKQVGRSAMLVDNLKEALPAFDESLRIRDDVECGRWRAHCLRETGKYQEALEQLNLVYDRNEAMKRDVSIHVDLAMLYVLNERLPLAKDYLAKAEALDPLFRPTQLTKSAYLYRAGQQEDSVRLLRSLVNSGEVKEDDLRKWPVLKEVMASKAYRDSKR